MLVLSSPVVHVGVPSSSLLTKHGPHQPFRGSQASRFAYTAQLGIALALSKQPIHPGSGRGSVEIYPAPTEREDLHDQASHLHTSSHHRGWCCPPNPNQPSNRDLKPGKASWCFVLVMSKDEQREKVELTPGLTTPVFFLSSALSSGQQDASNVQVKWEALVKQAPEELGTCYKLVLHIFGAEFIPVQHPY